MKNKSIKCKIIAMALMASLAISSSSIVFAANIGTANIGTTVTSNIAQQGEVPPPPGGETGGGPGGGTVVTSGTAEYTQSGDTVSKSDESITAAEANESIIKVTDAGNLTISNSTLTKSGGDTTSEEGSNFYGVNAGVLSESGSTINVSGCTINTSADGSNAVFATGTGSMVNVSDVTINTTGNSSRGLDATLTGTVNANNIKITTQGAHCATLATDRGNGTINVTNATLNTAGEGSPGIYSTGTIKVANSNITATGSEAAAIEGKNSITLTDTNISGAVKRGVMLYQSFSGDAEVGTSSFNMTRGTLKAAVGPAFYVTNTDSIVNLKNVSITNPSEILLTASADSWGTTGANGGKVTLNADSQELSGAVTCDSISTVALSLTNSSTLKSVINAANTGKSVTLSLDATSIWNVTGTSYLTSFTDADSTLANIHDNGNTIYYDSSASANNWLNGQTITLQDGGQLTPIAK